MKKTVDITLAGIIYNENRLYEGNLIPYFKVIFNNAQNLNRPYHNFSHMFYVVWACYQACVYYSYRGGNLSPRKMRDLLIAAMFHDFDHSGMAGNDDLNIARSVRALEKYILPEDRPHMEDIALLIRATEFPYKIASEELSLSGQIIRDADVAQTFSEAWIQQIIFGLSAEWSKTPIEILKAQISFLKGIKFHTEWGRKMVTEADIIRKLYEVRDFLEFLDVPRSESMK